MADFEEIEVDFEGISSHKVDVAQLDYRSEDVLSDLSLKPNELDLLHLSGQSVKS